MEKIIVATILKSKGLKGEVKTEFYVEADLAKKIKQVFINSKKFNIESSYIASDNWFIKLAEINSIDEADKLKGQDIEVLRSDLGDEILTIDLIGKQLVLTSGVEIGKLTNIIEIAKTETLEVDSGLFYLPNTEDLIIEINEKILLDEKRFKELTEYDE